MSLHRMLAATTMLLFASPASAELTQRQTKCVERLIAEFNRDQFANYKTYKENHWAGQDWELYRIRAVAITVALFCVREDDK